jgi:hypothetical protein
METRLYAPMGFQLSDLRAFFRIAFYTGEISDYNFVSGLFLVEKAYF